MLNATKSTVKDTLNVIAIKQSLEGNDILALVMEDFDGFDIEASILSSLGDIANTIARNFPEGIIPASWGFRCGAGGAEDAETSFAQEIESWGVTFFQLRDAGNALNQAFEALNS